MAKEQKFWLKRSMVPKDQVGRKMLEVTLRWRENSPMGAKSSQRTVRADDVLEGEQWAEFPELEPYEAPEPVQPPKAVEEPAEKKEEAPEAEEKPSGKTTTKTTSGKGKK